MAKQSTQTRESKTSNKTGRRPKALNMLIQDHEDVKKNFANFEDASDSKKEKLLEETLTALMVHTKLEEELVYPLFEQENPDLIEEAKEEHRLADFLIAELKNMKPGDHHFDAKFKLLGEMVKHHIEEEEGELFPQMQKDDSIDFRELENNMRDRKDELQEEYSDLNSIGSFSSLHPEKKR